MRFLLNPTYEYYKSRTKNQIRAIEFSEKEHIENFQLQQLKKIINTAYKNTVYYKELFNSNGIKTEDIKKIEDIRNIPLLDKFALKKKVEDFKSNKYPEFLFEKKNTGGTTGTPLTFYKLRSISGIIERTFIHNIWNRFGYREGLKIAALKGESIGYDDPKIISSYNKSRNILTFSSYKLNEKSFNKYYDQINDFDPSFFHAYPSVIHRFGKYLLENKRNRFKSLRGIICVSENLYDWQREEIEEIFGVPTFSHYGHAEGCVLAGNCEESRKFHIEPVYGYVELIDNDGEIITEPNIEGEIVATSLLNYVMPFIRYKTGDRASYSSEKCTCGRNYVTLNTISGRIQEYFIGGDGQKMPVTGNYLIHKNLKGVLKLQFIQDFPGEVTLKVIPGKDFSNESIDLINAGINRRYGGQLKVNIEIAESVESTNGKYRYIIQNIKEI